MCSSYYKSQEWCDLINQQISYSSFVKPLWTFHCALCPLASWKCASESMHHLSATWTWRPVAGFLLSIQCCLLGTGSKLSILLCPAQAWRELIKHIMPHFTSIEISLICKDTLSFGSHFEMVLEALFFWKLISVLRMNDAIGTWELGIIMTLAAHTPPFCLHSKAWQCLWFAFQT